MKAYSIDLRARIVGAVNRGMGKAEAARVYAVGLSTVKRDVRQHGETGQLRPKPRPGRAREIAPGAEAALRAQVAAHAAATLGAHCRRWAEEQGVAVSRATMSRALARAGLPLKKSR
jgi:transposase